MYAFTSQCWEICSLRHVHIASKQHVDRHCDAFAHQLYSLWYLALPQAMQLAFESIRVPIDMLLQALLPATIDSVLKDVKEIVAAYVNKASGIGNEASPQ